MTEVVIYTLSAIALYFMADAALNLLESIHGEPIPHRNIVFFVIILSLALMWFQAIKMVLAG
ncbi:MAG: hypothetical protein CMQ21_03220 [Gammaproteobacteria bacterium]|nr:hypothetical protein [Gammaproteobacteria bacterium]